MQFIFPFQIKRKALALWLYLTHVLKVRTTLRFNLALFVWLWFPSLLSGQSFETRKATENNYTYEYVEGDPTETRIYTLKNGLKVYLSVYRDRPQIFTLIPVRAGSKNDPADNTGLAHYLEHMVFKGTSRIGTKDYSKEKILLDSIERMFNRYRKLKDPEQRKALYKKIDRTSYEASKWCYANEYDKLIASIGGQGTNAFTSTEQTVYMNTIPSNQLEKWLLIEKERFGMLVPRLFHTELEAVYEEKNMALDSDGDKVQETLMATLYKKHPYGTQTTIGTVGHLKNPSITEIRNYFNKYYVPNNMAICLAGDLDPSRTIRLIDSTFGQMTARPVPAFIPPVEAPITQPEIKRVVGPEEESVTIGFRFPGFGTRESRLAFLVDQMLQNSQAGLIDINLLQPQKVLQAGSYFDEGKDYSSHILVGTPRKGQTLAQVRKLLLDQLDSLKEGRFGDWLIPAIVNNLKISQLRKFDNNQGRAFVQLEAFIMDAPWAKIWKATEELKQVSKGEIQEFVRRNYGANYVSIEKVIGKDEKVQKITKPSITPIVLDKEGSSDFSKEIQNLRNPEIEPIFLDFSKDLTTITWKNKVELLYKKNTSTPLFQLTFLVDIGTDHNPKLDLLDQLFDLTGGGELTSIQLKKELYKLGTDLSLSSEGDQTSITVSGLQENFLASVTLLEKVLSAPAATPKDLENLIQGILKERENLVLDKQALLFYGLGSYARYGPVSPATNVVKNKDLKLVRLEELLELMQRLTSYPHKILYYGPAEPNEIGMVLEKVHSIPEKWAGLPEKKVFQPLPTDSNRVFWIDYDMVQTELYFQSRSVLQDTSLIVPASLFNEYMGGNMSSVVFQELRESKALAYSANGGYQLAQETGKHNYVTSYIGCQADKLPEAMHSMLDLLQNMPAQEKSLEMSKSFILGRLQSERTTKAGILYAYLRARKQGLKGDAKKTMFENLPGLGLVELKDFHSRFVRDRKYTLSLVGKRENINFEVLRKFGPVKELKASEIFGF